MTGKKIKRQWRPEPHLPYFTKRHWPYYSGIRHKSDFEHACHFMVQCQTMRALLVRILKGVEREGFTDAPLWDEVRAILQQTEQRS